MHFTRVPGFNIDKIDIQAGLSELEACGYNRDSWQTFSVIDMALRRWARGEEESAQRMAIDKTFHGIDLTSWTRVIAAARAAALIK